MAKISQKGRFKPLVSFSAWLCDLVVGLLITYMTTKFPVGNSNYFQGLN